MPKMRTEMALKIMGFCQDELHLEEGEAAQSMAMAAAMLSGNEHNILGLIKMMLETYEIMEEENNS
jgi:hypothetical protein